jgi:hypothetical protein
MQRNDNSGEQNIIVTVSEGIILPEADVPEGYTLKGGLLVPTTAKTGIILSQPELPDSIAGVMLASGEVKIEEPKKLKIILPTAAEVKKLKLS